MNKCPDDCPIPGARSFSQPEGTGSLRVLILGEALGEAEAADGLPFRPYAPAGSLLERAIRRSSFTRDQFVLWNVVPVQPPKNWLEGAPWEAAAVAWGLPMLRKVIDDYKPAVFWRWETWRSGRLLGSLALVLIGASLLGASLAYLLWAASTHLSSGAAPCPS